MNLVITLIKMNIILDLILLLTKTLSGQRSRIHKNIGAFLIFFNTIAGIAFVSGEPP